MSITDYFLEHWKGHQCSTQLSHLDCRVSFAIKFSSNAKILTTVNVKLLYFLVACVFSDNICAYSCLPSPGDRVEEVEKLYETGTALFNCPAIKDSQHYKQESVGQPARDVHKEGKPHFHNKTV